MEEVLKKRQAVLQVKMFGNFSLTYEGKSLLGRKTGETQFSSLMQILLHNREKGVSRELLEEVVFGEREIENIHHAMQSVVYNAKKKLEKFGLPKANYITLEKGIFYWTSEIPVAEDAAEFESLYREAEAEEDLEQRLQFLLDACHCYSGEFLSAYAGVMWAASEARRYRGQFFSCVEEAAQLLRERKEFLQMKQLGIYAASVEPFSDWETITMEALLEMGQYDEASSLYASTVDMYFQERGLHPSQKLMNFLEQLGSQMTHSYESLDNIQAALAAHQGSTDGGYYCSYPVFQGIYHMVTRMMERGGQAVYLMLCTIVDSKGNPMKEGEQLDALSDRLGDAIRSSVRHGDAVNRYGKGQYLVLLVNITRENCAIVEKRIDSRFLVGRQRTGVRYYVNSVICKIDE